MIYLLKSSSKTAKHRFNLSMMILISNIIAFNADYRYYKEIDGMMNRRKRVTDMSRGAQSRSFLNSIGVI